MSEEKEICTLRDIFDGNIQKYPDRTSFSQIKGESLTYREFGERVRKIASVLETCGVEKGDKVILFSGSMPNWPAAYLAICITGCVVVPLLPDFTAFELANIIEHSGAKDVLVSKKLYYKLSPSVFDSIRSVTVLDDLSIVKGNSDEMNVARSDGYGTGVLMAGSPDQDDVASIIYTSGTSGSSKGVMLTHRNLVSQVKMAYELFPVDENDVFLSILPLSHAYECSIGMLYPFSRGSSVVYLSGAPTPSLLMPALQAVKPSIMLSVPLIVEKIYKNKVRPVFTKNFYMQFLYSIPLVRRMFHKVAGKKLLAMFGGNLRFFGIGGSKLDSMVERFLVDAGFPYAIGYGLTETAPLLAGAIPGKVPFRSTGPAISGVDLKILNPTADGIGEIVVKGPNVMKGYYRDKVKTESVYTEDGWFRTRDLGRLDKKGNLYIMGRVDNMILGASGENIYPEEIEAVINENDYVVESLVVKKKEKLIAMIYFNYDQIESMHHLSDGVKSMAEKLRTLKDELLEYVNSRVNNASRILEIQEQDVPFEKTATQKIKRYLYK